MYESRLGIIGGSGLGTDLEIENAERITVQTPYGNPSDRIVIGTIQGKSIAFLQRHGPGHSIPPNEINGRANIAALKHVGINRLISLSAVGGLADACIPGTFVIPDQFIDKTRTRGATTFFGHGLVGHVPFADPTCQSSRDLVSNHARNMGLPLIQSGTYIVMDGPQFSTRAESRLHRECGGTVIGMTAMPEAKLAREAELCYAMIAMVTDRDCGDDALGHVTAEVVAATMGQIARQARDLVSRICKSLAGETTRSECNCSRVLDESVVTDPSHRNPKAVERFSFVVPRISQIRAEV